MQVVCGYGQKPLGFQRCHIQNFRLLLDIKSKRHWPITCVYGKKPIHFQQYHFQNVTFIMSLSNNFGFFGIWTLYVAWFRERNSRLLWHFSFKFHVHIAHGHGLRLAMLLSKRPPGGHIVFISFRILTFVWLLISSPTFRSTLFVWKETYSDFSVSWL